MKDSIIIEIIKPRAPRTTIPIADIFAIVENSCFDGFFNTSQTLFDFAANCFNFLNMLSMLFERNI